MLHLLFRISRTIAGPPLQAILEHCKQGGGQEGLRPPCTVGRLVQVLILTSTSPTVSPTSLPSMPWIGTAALAVLPHGRKPFRLWMRLAPRCWTPADFFRPTMESMGFGPFPGT